jgi:hypothetical protein
MNSDPKSKETAPAEISIDFSEIQIDFEGTRAECEAAKSGAQDRADTDGDDAGKRKLRKGEPANVLLPRTLTWAARLAPGIQPHALMRRFARIANSLAADWEHPATTYAYLNSLLIDKRPGRKGFPAEIVAELLALRRHYLDLHPENPNAAARSRFR